MPDIDCPLAKAAELWPNQVGWMTEDVSCSFEAWHKYVRRTTDILRARGWQSGDCIGLEATSAPTLLTIYWALSRIGIAACLVSPRWPTPQIELAANKTKWVDYLTSDAQERWLKSIPTPSRFPAADAIRRTPDKTMIATILLSSGSMGSPKAIAHTQSAHVINAQGANSNIPLVPGDRWLLSLSLAHVGGVGILYRCVLSGATIVLASSKGSLISQLEKWQPSHLSLVPTQLKRILESGIRPWPQLKAVLLGGAPIPGGLIDQAFAAKWPLVTTYGLTEMASQVTATRLGATPAELKTAGGALPDREVQISDEGEILVRGGSLFSGYLDQGLVTPATNKQGWFATRDRGVWDTSGNLLVLGRLDNLFISGGENIYPEEIETELLHLPAIMQALVVAIEDVEYGRRPVVFIDSERWEPELWRQSLRARLPSFKVPDYFLPWPADIPLKPSRPQMAEFARRELSNFSG